MRSQASIRRTFEDETVTKFRTSLARPSNLPSFAPVRSGRRGLELEKPDCCVRRRLYSRSTPGTVDRLQDALVRITSKRKRFGTPFKRSSCNAELRIDSQRICRRTHCRERTQNRAGLWQHPSSRYAPASCDFRLGCTVLLKYQSILLMQHGACKHTLKRSRRCQATEQSTNLGKPEDEVDMEVSYQAQLLSRQQESVY